MNLSNGEQIDLYIILIQVQHITILLEITVCIYCVFFLDCIDCIALVYMILRDHIRK